jgi:hypothetical protein
MERGKGGRMGPTLPVFHPSNPPNAIKAETQSLEIWKLEGFTNQN